MILFVNFSTKGYITRNPNSIYAYHTSYETFSKNLRVLEKPYAYNYKRVMIGRYEIDKFRVNTR